VQTPALPKKKKKPTKQKKTESNLGKSLGLSVPVSSTVKLGS
jgi:hypothetical protein